MKVTIYTPENKHKASERFRSIIKDLIEGHALGRRLFIRDFKALYRQSLIGFFWAFIPAIATSLIWILLNKSNVVSVPDTSVSYPLFVVVGTILWQVFSDAINEPIRAVSTNKSAIVKLNFPREAIIVSAFYSTLTNFIIKIVVLFSVIFFLDFELNESILLFPLGVFAIILLGFAIGILLLPMSFLYTDIARMVPMGLQFLMYLTPVVYPSPKIGFFKELMRFNPVEPILTCSRNWLVGLPVDDVYSFIVVACGSVVTIIIGLLIFKITIPIVVERIGA